MLFVARGRQEGERAVEPSWLLGVPRLPGVPGLGCFPVLQQFLLFSLSFQPFCVTVPVGGRAAAERVRLDQEWVEACVGLGRVG